MPWTKACESVVLRVPWCSEFSRRWVTRYPKLWDVAVMQDFAKCYKSFFQFLEVDIERNWDSFASTTNGSRLGIGFLVYKDDHGVLQQRFCFQLQVLRLIVFVHQIFVWFCNCPFLSIFSAWSSEALKNLFIFLPSIDCETKRCCHQGRTWPWWIAR